MTGQQTPEPPLAPWRKTLRINIAVSAAAFLLVGLPAAAIAYYAAPGLDQPAFAITTGIVAGGFPALGITAAIWCVRWDEEDRRRQRRENATWLTTLTRMGYTPEQARLLRRRYPRWTPDNSLSDTARWLEQAEAAGFTRQQALLLSRPNANEGHDR